MVEMVEMVEMDDPAPPSGATAIRHRFAALAASLAAAPDRARATAVACVVEIGGEGGGIWTIDLRHDPPLVTPADSPGAPCRIRIGSEDFLALCRDPSQVDRMAWAGRLELSGADRTLSEIRRLLFGTQLDAANPAAGYYRALAHLLPDQRFQFMNHGYCDAHEGNEENEESEESGGLRGEDLPWRYSIQLVRHVLAGLELRGSTVLDAGCGRGGASSYLTRYHQPARVVSLDLCAEAVHLCARTHRLAGLSFLQADAQRLPLAGGVFDVVLNVESCHCYPDPPAFLSEVARVLKPGGFLCLADALAPAALAPFEGELIPAAGFAVVRSTDITHQVAQGIERNRHQLAELLSSMASSELGNRRLIEQVLRSVNDDKYHRYRERLTVYHSWLLRKPGTPPAGAAGPADRVSSTPLPGKDSRRWPGPAAGG
jgi:ubiquinone/menaquinone biosynthesis C-methylase UbiE